MMTIPDCAILDHIVPVDADASFLNGSASHWNVIDQLFYCVCYETFRCLFLSEIPSIILQLDIKRKKEYIY